MTIHLHHLRGCAPAPLAHYLKAIGILRLVAQQKDPDARGFWRDQHFCLLTTLDEAALEAFFLDEYAPTPFVAPWNKGSGFYKENDKGIAPIERSTARRFESFRLGIREAREPLGAISKADAAVRSIKSRTKTKGLSNQDRERLRDDPEYKKELAAAEREFKRLKADLYRPLARKWRGPHRDWMDAAMVLSATGEPAWPSLLGTGGNDGNFEFTNSAMQRLGDLFNLDSADAAPSAPAKALLNTALFETPSAELMTASAGQFLPGASGGANGTTGPAAEGSINPWDFVLMLEGVITFRGNATRRLGARDGTRAAMPFALASHAVGYATPGTEKSERGEQWMPLWERPASWNDVTALFAEGRAQVGRSVAKRPLDFARAIARLGIARGLSGFVRYGYLERNGMSHLAVPLGRVAVTARPRARLIDDFSGWLDRLQREASDAPARLSASVGALSNAAFNALTREDEPTRWQSLLLAIAAVERVQASGTAFNVGPCPTLSPGWIEAAADGTPEWRLALALGSAARGYKDGRPFDSVRAHALPLDPKKGWSYAIGADKRLINDPRVVMTGRDPQRDLIALVTRRLVEASQRGSRTLPLVSKSGAGAQLDDLARFLAGNVDVERIVSLGRALMALDWGRARLTPTRVGPRSRDERPDEAWAALRLCTLPFAVRERNIATDPAMLRRLTAGDVAGAVDLALRRLRASQFRPPLVAAIADSATARRWAAALAFPIAPAVADVMADHFENPSARETV